MENYIDFLPHKFLLRMKEMEQTGRFDYEAFCRSYRQPPFRGLRLNPLKCTAAAEMRLNSYFSKPLLTTPFGKDTYYLPPETEGIGRLPLHHGGAFYVQEPSASSAVEVLAPQPGDKVLDLCAAPGGKSTQIGAALAGRGLLWANEIIKSRAQILLSNVERMGIRNAVVSSCHPERLCSRLAGYFDKVLVDAPCSGEGMFAKEPQAVEEWSPAHVAACAERQLAILDSAQQALRDGGVMVYSTCTFSPEENEGVICRFLQEHPWFELVDCGVSFGRPAYPQMGEGRKELLLARRIFPMDGGAGHFVAKLVRRGENPRYPAAYQPLKQEKETVEMEKLYAQIFSTACYGRVENLGGRLLILPQELPGLEGLGVLRAGVLAGECKTGRIEPAHGLFAAARPKELRQSVCLNGDEGEAFRFLRGEEINCGAKGYTGVVIDDVVIGFGKCSNGRLKNRYPKGLRNLQ